MTLRHSSSNLDANHELVNDAKPLDSKQITQILRDISFGNFKIERLSILILVMSNLEKLRQLQQSTQLVEVAKVSF